MKTVAAKLYEGMFLVDSALAASDWQGVNDTIRSILERAGAEIVTMRKWDERRLAYDITGKSRGTYILTYFRVDGPKIAEIERAVQLSESIMRALILCVEGVDAEYLDTERPAPADDQDAQASEDEDSDDELDYDDEDDEVYGDTDSDEQQQDEQADDTSNGDNKEQ